MFIKKSFFPNSLIIIMLHILILTNILVGKEYRVAVVKDGPSYDDMIIAQIESEVRHMLGTRHSIIFDNADKFNAQWQTGRYKTVLLNALQDRNIDMILGLGVLVVQEAAAEGMVLSKPFISATALNGNLPKLNYSKDDYSLKNNLAVIVHTNDAGHDLQIFSDIWKFNRLHVGIGKEIYENLVDLKPAFQNYSEMYNTEIIPVPVSTDVDEAISLISDDVQAAYLISIPRLDTNQRQQIIDVLNEHKIPSFSALGPGDLELGALATNRMDLQQEVIRRTALNIFNLIEGASTKDLPVFLLSDPKLQINARTAVAIGYSPNYEARVSANFLYPEAFESDARPLTISEVITLARENNKDLFISQARTEYAGKNKSVARSPMLPQLGISGSYTYYDMAAVGVILPEQWLQLNLRLRQMIYDDRTISDYRASDRQYDAAKYLNESTILNVYKSAVSSFLLLTQARLIHEIQVSNLKLTEGNLDIAKMRVDVGNSGQDEVYRWQAELANRKSAVLNTEAIVEGRRITLNQVLGVDQDQAWQPQEISINPETFNWMNGAFEDVFQTQESMLKFTSALLIYALKSSPEINVLIKEKEAQEIILGQRKRSYFLPNVSADLSYGNNLDQYPAEPELGDYSVQAGVTASLPLFEGTRRIHDVQRQKARLNEINSQLLKTEELVERRLRAAVANLEASFPNIRFSAEAAENAALNFDVVREKYANGIVGITDLLEAQTTTLTAELQAVSATYKFLDYMAELQRALAFFTETKTEEEIQAFVEAIKNEMNKE